MGPGLFVSTPLRVVLCEFGTALLLPATDFPYRPSLEDESEDDSAGSLPKLILRDRGSSNPARGSAYRPRKTESEEDELDARDSGAELEPPIVRLLSP